MSAVEAFTNVVVGHLVAVTANWPVLPRFAFAVSMVDSAAIGLVFFSDRGDTGLRASAPV